MGSQPWFVSSADPENLSLTLKGLLTMLIPLIIIAGKYFHFSLTEGDISNFIVVVVAAVSAIMTLFGLLRKIYFAVVTNKN